MPGTRLEASKKRCEVDPFAFTQGLNSRPEPFNATFTVRSQEKAAIIQNEWNGAGKDVELYC